MTESSLGDKKLRKAYLEGYGNACRNNAKPRPVPWVICLCCAMLGFLLAWVVDDSVLSAQWKALATERKAVACEWRLVNTSIRQQQKVYFALNDEINEAELDFNRVAKAWNWNHPKQHVKLFKIKGE